MSRIVVNNEIAVKKLPMIIELEAIKSIIVDSDNKEVKVSSQYREENGLEGDIEIVSNITIKWSDGESSVFVVTQYNMNTLITHIYTTFQNDVAITEAQFDELYADEIEESTEEEYEEDEYEDDEEYEEQEEEDEEEIEEEIEEEMLNDSEQDLPFPKGN
jgi:hypothetical protein